MHNDNKLVNIIEDIFKDIVEHTHTTLKRSFTTFQEKETEVFIKCFHALIEYHINRVVQKTFIYEFHEFRKSLNMPANPNSSVAFDLFLQKLDKQMVEKWLNKYSYLRTIIHTIINNTSLYIIAVCKNFKEDIDQLNNNEMISKNSYLTAINALDSDPHNGSKIVLCFEFSNEEKILYKPRSLEIDQLIDTIFSDILKFKGLKYNTPIAQTICRNSYGWQKFISHTFIDEADLSEAYYNLGLCAAVFRSIGATDLHDENVIFNGTTPYFIDLETSLKPSHEEINEDSIWDVLNKELSNSIANTCIIPAKLMVAPHNILIGAINTPYPQKTEELCFTLTNPGTDAVDISKQNIIVSRDSAPIMLEKNKFPSPLPYQQDFVNGYEEGIKSVIVNREKISDLLSSFPCTSRIIVRPTVQYFFLLDACLYPENLIDESAIDKILSYMKPSKMFTESENASKVLEAEKKALKKGDIPYFSIGSNKHTINLMNINTNTFEMSPIENALYSLNNLSDRALLIDKRLIAEGFSEIRIHEATFENNKTKKSQAKMFTDVLKEVTIDNPDALFKLIINQSITTKSKNAETGWLNGVYGDMNIAYNSISCISLHDAGGILFLLKHLTEYKRCVDDIETNELYIRASKGVNSLKNTIYGSTEVSNTPMSIISGSNSLEFLFNHEQKKLKYLDKTISKIQLENIESGDVFLGPIGIALVNATFPNTSIDNIIYFTEKFHNTKLPSEGIAHGNLGVLWTNFRLNYALDRLDICKNIFHETTRIKFEESVENVGWCNGNSGLLMVLTEMATLLKVDINLFDLAKKSTILPLETPLDLSICHGVSGVLQSLLFSFKVSKKSEYIMLANEYWLSVLKLIDINGYYTGEKNRDYLLGYFLGWSGMADSALLLKMYNEGSSPLIPLNLSSLDYQKKLMEV